MSKRVFIVALSYLKRKKLQSLLLILLISMIIVLFTMSLILLSSKNSVESIFNDQSAAENLIIANNDESYINEMVQYIKSLKEIRNVSTTDFYAPELKEVYHNNKKIEVKAIYQSYDRELTTNKIKIIKSDSKAAMPKENEIFMPSSVAFNENIKIGDSWSFYKDNKKIEFKVAAITLDAHFSSGIDPARMYISSKYFHKLSKSGSLISIFYNNYSELKEIDFTQKIHAKYDRSLKGEIFDFNEFKLEYLGISELLAVIFIFIAIVILFISIVAIANAINISIDEEYVSIGILKSCGFLNREIRLIYILRYFVITLIAIPVGITIIIPVKNVLLNNITNLFSNLNMGIFSMEPLIITISIVIFVVVVFAFLFSFKAANIKPVESIKYNGSQFKNRKSRIDITKKSLLPTTFLLALKDIFTYKLRSIFFIAMLMMCVFISVIAINSNETFSRKSTIKELAGITKYDIEIRNLYQSAKITDEYIIDKIKEIKGIKLIYTKKDVPTSSIYREDLDRTVTINGFAYSNYEDINYPFLFGSSPKNANEIAFDMTTAKILNKDIGDYIEITMEGIKKNMLITSLYQSFDSFTYYIPEKAIPANNMREAKSYRTKIYLVLQDKSEKNLIYDKIADRFKQSIEINKISKGETSFKEKSDKIAYILLLISIIIVITSVVIVVNRILMEIRMCTRIIGIYKSFGFTNNRIKQIYLIKVFILSSVACVLGTSLSLFLSSRLINGILRTKTAVYELKILPSFDKLLIINLIFLIAILLATYISTNKIKKVSVRNLINL